MKNCLFCYQTLDNDTSDYHPTCSKKLFGTPHPPLIDFNLSELHELAKEHVIHSKAVTGVQAKLSLNVLKEHNQPARLTMIGLHGDFILKPPSTEFKELPENEDVTMHLAELVKIKTAQHGLIRLKSGELAYITRRFDRHKGNKIAVEDFCQLTENLTEQKYRGSIELIGRTANRFTANKGYEAQRLFELVLFSFLTGNADMHLKNFSLIENAIGEYEFSPAYDLLSTKLALPEDKEESALTINGKKHKISKKDFDALAISLNINEKSLQAIYNRFITIIPAWEAFIKQSFLSEETQKTYISLIQEQQQKVLS
jgi:serine/threonine-protein kinase HipA